MRGTSDPALRHAHDVRQRTQAFPDRPVVPGVNRCRDIDDIVTANAILTPRRQLLKLLPHLEGVREVPAGHRDLAERPAVEQVVVYAFAVGRCSDASLNVEPG